MCTDLYLGQRLSFPVPVLLLGVHCLLVRLARGSGVVPRLGWPSRKFECDDCFFFLYCRCLGVVVQVPGYNPYEEGEENKEDDASNSDGSDGPPIGDGVWERDMVLDSFGHW
jgi:hypothetical protein